MGAGELPKSPEGRRPSGGRRPDDEAHVRQLLDAARRAMELSRDKKVGNLDAEDETTLALARLLETAIIYLMQVPMVPIAAKE